MKIFCLQEKLLWFFCIQKSKRFLGNQEINILFSLNERVLDKNIIVKLNHKPIFVYSINIKNF